MILFILQQHLMKPHTSNITVQYVCIDESFSLISKFAILETLLKIKHVKLIQAIRK
jgi:hypothetical protein